MSVVTSLRQADIFYDLTLTQLELIASICVERSYNAGDLVFEENSSGSDLYVIAEGAVDIQINPSLVGKDDRSAPYSVAHLRRGQSFGEVALVDEGLRSAGAVAAEDNTVLLAIPRDKLMMICNAYSQLGYRVMRNLAADLAMKMRSTDMRVRELVSAMRRDED